MKGKNSAKLLLTLFWVVLLNLVVYGQPVLTAPADSALNIPTNQLFTWAAVPSATGYRIVVSTDSTFASVTINQTTTSTSFQSAGLVNAARYYWKVSSTVGGVTTYSVIRTFKVKIITPVLATPSNSTVGAATNVTLSWGGIAGIDNYTLQVSTVSDFSSTVYNQSNLTSASQAMSSLAYYQVFYWRVKATTTDGNSSDYTTSRTFTTIQAPPTISTPANNSLNYSFSKVTYTWAATPSATSYELQVCKSNLFTTSDLKVYSNLTGTTYTPADYLDYNQQYYWRMRVKIGTIMSDYSSTYTFTTGTPSTSITDANAAIIFDHVNGRISQITFKQGSNKQMLNTYYNDKNKTGLGRINNETSTKLASWSESGSTYAYTYDNVLYGSKTLTVTWDANGITVDMHLVLDANKSAAVTSAFQPGGDNGPLHDYIMYANASDLFTKTYLSYPGSAAALYSGTTLLTAMMDDRYSTGEYFGYKTSSAVTTLLQHNSTCAPAFSYASAIGAQTIDLSFAIKNKTNFFTWANKKYIIVKTPAADDKLLNQSSSVVTWESFGVAGTVNINLSTTGAAPFGTSLAAATANDGTQTVTLPDVTPPKTSCAIQVAGTGATGVSGVFSITSGTATVISISNGLTGAPSAQVTVPILISPGTGASINAFDLRVIYNKDVLTFLSSSAGALLTNWVSDATNNSTNGYLQIGGFKSSGSAITTSGTLMTITFLIKSSGRVGTQTPLNINNSYLSAANGSALPLTIIGSDGLLTLYSRISGRLRYVNLLKTSITGPNLVKFIDAENTDTTNVAAGTGGFFDISNKKPGSVVTITPGYSNVYHDTLVAKAVKATDARTAFDGREGGSINLSAIQKIAADVNKDGYINSTDALAILQISTGALHATDFGNTQWIFFDSTFTLNTTNWASAPRLKTYSPLDTVKANQSFYGLVAGDVLLDYTPTALAKASLFDPNAVQYSVPFRMNVKPGDTLFLPLTVKLNGKSIGAFNASVQINRNLLTYCDKYTAGSSLPVDKGWALSTYFDATGKLNIAATDFSGALDPITADGTIAVFKFVVKEGVRIGDTTPVQLSGLSVADSRLAPLPVSNVNGIVTISTVTSADKVKLPNEFSISQNYPNPFNPSTTIKFTIPVQTKVKLNVYNAIGQLVTTLVNQELTAGIHEVKFNGYNYPSGVYFYQITADNYTNTKKFILLK